MRKISEQVNGAQLGCIIVRTAPKWALYQDSLIQQAALIVQHATPLRRAGKKVQNVHTAQVTPALPYCSPERARMAVGRPVVLVQAQSLTCSYFSTAAFQGSKVVID